MKQSASSSPTNTQSDNNFIPNLCAVQNVFILVISTQVLAFIIAIVRTQSGFIDWTGLGAASVLMHLISMTSAAIICSTRHKLARLSLNAQSALCIGVIVTMTALYSAFSTELLPHSAQAPDPDFIFRNSVIAMLICGLIARYLFISYLAKQNEKAELEARIQALQSRIRPHFLFNSMNSIASLISSQPDTAEEAVLDLCELFRATLNTQSRYVQIREELDLCRKYLNIEGLRLGSRLHVEWDIRGGVNHFLIPPLTLQPLVENAIYHGIQPLDTGGTIHIESYESDGSVYVLISNPFQTRQHDHHGNQLALGNISARLNALFSGKAILKTSQHDGRFTATLRFPATKEPL